MKKIILGLVLLFFVGCASNQQNTKVNNGKIIEKSDEYVIWTRFQYDLNLLKVEIPKEVTDHCTSFKKNTYRLVHDESKTWVILFEPLSSWPDVYRYICAENEMAAKDIRKKLLLTDSYFNQQSFKWYEENFKKNYIYGQPFKDNFIFLTYETDEYISEKIKKRLAQDELNKKKLEEDQRQSRLKYLEDKFGSKCSKNKANNAEYNKCLNEQEQIAKKEKANQEAKQAEENKKKQLITEKQKTEEDKLNKMLANMKPEERRAYVCEKTYGLKKGSDKFSECVYKILAADVELEKIELQKKLAEAQLETAKANEAAARANAAASSSRGNVSSYDPNVAAAMDRANEIERAKILLNLSQALRTPPASPQLNAPPRQQNCKLNPYNNRITCY